MTDQERIAQLEAEVARLHRGTRTDQQHVVLVSFDMDDLRKAYWSIMRTVVLVGAGVVTGHLLWSWWRP